MENKQNEEIRTVAEAAKFLRCSTAYVYKLVNDGSLKAFRLGRAIRLTQSELERYTSGDKREAV